MEEEHHENHPPTLYSLDKKLSTLILMFNGHRDNTAKDIDRHQGKLERHDREFYGDGTDGNQGLKNNMTRVLIIMKILIWVMATVSTALIGLLLNAAWSLMTKHQ